jgi:aminopeptidase N
MLSFYLTEEVFLKGLNLYLTRHSYANATSDVPRLPAKNATDGAV